MSFTLPEYTIYHAAAADDVEAVAKLIRKGADVNLPEHGSTDNWFLLHWAAYNGNAALAQLLIRSGANVNVMCTAGNIGTPLHLAALWGKLSVAELLVKAGADLTAKCNGSTPLQHANGMGQANVAEMLRKYGAKE
jgi:ankyrin repeat protein